MTWNVAFSIQRDAETCIFIFYILWITFMGKSSKRVSSATVFCRSFCYAHSLIQWANEANGEPKPNQIEEIK